MSSRTRLLAVLSAASLAVAACSGGGGGGTRQATSGAGSGGKPAGEPAGIVQQGPLPGATGRSAGGPSHAVSAAQTVLGMHFVQMRSDVAPVVASLRSQISAGGTVTAPTSSQLQQTESALTLFDTAAARTTAPSGMTAQIQALVSADTTLLGQLQSLTGGAAVSQSTAQTLSSGLSGWETAAGNAGTALSA